MKNFSLTVLNLLLVLMISLSGCGGGGGKKTPTWISLPKTGQIVSYDANTIKADDGALQRGIAWPVPRFTDNGNGTISDTLTGLVWAKNANLMTTLNPDFDKDGTINDGSVTWQHALDYIIELNNGNYLGFNDWRLPNINELASLIHSGETSLSTWLNNQGFLNANKSFWSSSSRTVSYHYHVNMGYGDLRSDFSEYDAVWPVRGNSVKLPKTGQTVSYDTNPTPADDGGNPRGKSWPVPRFIDNGNGTVTDNLTKLSWTKDANLMVSRDPAFDQDDSANDGKVTWQHALDYAAKLNGEEYLGYDDWRLPNRNEFQSLTKAGGSMGEWLSLTFSNILSGILYRHWTSTTSPTYTDQAFFYSIGLEGHADYWSKTSGYWHVWPVRGGE